MNEFDPLASGAPLIVYIDCKSPYAYAAWQPTWQLHSELGVEIDWRFFTLDIPSYLGSARQDESGHVVDSDRSPRQWSQVRYAYHDARRYLALRGRTLRGTTKIWDSSFAAIAFSWAKRQGNVALRRFGELLFERFWRREIDVEDPRALAALLRESGVRDDGFLAWLEGAGRSEHDETQERIFDAGIFGVPTYVVAGEFLFGREHLPRVRWLLEGREGPAPDAAYSAPIHVSADQKPETGQRGAAVKRKKRLSQRLDVWIDFRNPYCYLALEPSLTLAEQFPGTIVWHPCVARPFRVLPSPSPGASRGERHRAFRSAYRADELYRYARDLGLPLDLPVRTVDSSLAAMALTWTSARATGHVPALLRHLFRGHFENRIDIESLDAIARSLARLGIPSDGFAAYTEGAGRSELARAQRALEEVGVVDLPLYLLEGEPYAGRQHLPMIRSILAGAPAAAALRSSD